MNLHERALKTFFRCPFVPRDTGNPRINAFLPLRLDMQLKDGEFIRYFIRRDAKMNAGLPGNAIEPFIREDDFVRGNGWSN